MLADPPRTDDARLPPPRKEADRGVAEVASQTVIGQQQVVAIAPRRLSALRAALACETARVVQALWRGRRCRAVLAAERLAARAREAEAASSGGAHSVQAEPLLFDIYSSAGDDDHLRPRPLRCMGVGKGTGNSMVFIVSADATGKGYGHAEVGTDTVKSDGVGVLIGEPRSGSSPAAAAAVISSKGHTGEANVTGAEDTTGFTDCEEYRSGEDAGTQLGKGAVVGGPRTGSPLAAAATVAEDVSLDATVTPSGAMPVERQWVRSDGAHAAAAAAIVEAELDEQEDEDHKGTKGNLSPSAKRNHGGHVESQQEYRAVDRGPRTGSPLAAAAATGDIGLDGTAMLSAVELVERQRVQVDGGADAAAAAAVAEVDQEMRDVECHNDIKGDISSSAVDRGPRTGSPLAAAANLSPSAKRNHGGPVESQQVDRGPRTGSPLAAAAATGDIGLDGTAMLSAVELVERQRVQVDGGADAAAAAAVAEVDQEMRDVECHNDIKGDISSSAVDRGPRTGSPLAAATAAAAAGEGDERDGEDHIVFKDNLSTAENQKTEGSDLSATVTPSSAFVERPRVHVGGAPAAFAAAVADGDGDERDDEGYIDFKGSLPSAEAQKAAPTKKKISKYQRKRMRKAAEAEAAAAANEEPELAEPHLPEEDEEGVKTEPTTRAAAAAEQKDVQPPEPVPLDVLARELMASRLSNARRQELVSLFGDSSDAWEHRFRQALRDTDFAGVDDSDGRSALASLALYCAIDDFVSGSQPLKAMGRRVIANVAAAHRNARDVTAAELAPPSQFFIDALTRVGADGGSISSLAACTTSFETPMPEPVAINAIVTYGWGPAHCRAGGAAQQRLNRCGVG